MAFASDSTPARARSLLPLAAPLARDAHGRFAKRAQPRPELPPEPLLAAAREAEGTAPSACDASALAEKSAPESTAYRTEPDTLDAVRADLDALLGLCGRVERTEAFDDPDITPEVVGRLCSLGRELAMRRALEQAADHAAALLPLLGLPRLVGPDHIVVDPEAAGAALDTAIAALDALDEDPDLEDDEREDGGDDELSLGWREALTQTDLGRGQDDAEPTLGAPERSPWVPSLTAAYYEPPAGKRLWRGYGGKAHSQVAWAQGSQLEGEAEETDEDGDDLDKGEHDTADAEPSIGWPNDYRAVLGDHGQADDDRELDDADLEPDGERMAVRRPLGLADTPVASLVARGRALRSGVPAPDDGLARPWLGTDRVFGLHVEGDCCSPEILSHGAVHVDKEARPQAGDFVALWFEAMRAGRPVMVGWVKRLSCDLPFVTSWPFRAAPGNELVPLVMVESLNPPRQYMIDARRVHAIFQVVRIVPPAVAVAARQVQRAAVRR